MGSLRKSPWTWLRAQPQRLWYWGWRKVLNVVDPLAGRFGWSWLLRLRNFAWRRVCHKLCCDHIDYGDVCHGRPLRAAVTKPMPRACPDCQGGPACHQHAAEQPLRGFPV